MNAEQISHICFTHFPPENQESHSGKNCHRTLEMFSRQVKNKRRKKKGSANTCMSAGI